MSQPFRRLLLSVILSLSLSLIAGWLVDRWLGFAPLGLAIGGATGSIASVVLVCRTACRVFDAYPSTPGDPDAGERPED